jgi:uncharacterized protein (TIGR03437 family)
LLAASISCAALGQAPAYSINTVAGIGPNVYTAEGKTATGALLFDPAGVAADRNGNVYFSEQYFHRVLKVTPQGTLVTVAGTGATSYNGDGIAATSANIAPRGITVDSTGNLYIADGANERIRKVTPAGIISTVAGTGTAGYSGDGALATSAKLTNPADVQLDGTGSLYIADQGNNRIRKVTTAGVISTVAGTGTSGYSGDGGTATAAKLESPSALAVDPSGIVYISDSAVRRIRKVTTAGVISTIAGNGTSGYTGDGGQATQAEITAPAGMALDPSGNLYFADGTANVIRKVSPAGVISTVAGNNPATPNAGDGGLASASSLIDPLRMAADATGNLYLTEEVGRRVRRIDAETGIITRVAGANISGAGIGDGGPGLQASLDQPNGVRFDAQGNLLISDSADNLVRRISGGVITTFAGNGLSGEGPFGVQATGADLNYPMGLALDASGNVYIQQTNQISKVALNGTITAVAGTGVAGYSGDNGPAAVAQISPGQDIAIDRAGNLYIPDAGNNRIRMVDASGVITTIAGTGKAGYSGDNGPAIVAELNYPFGIAVGATGNIYFSDSNNNRVRKIDTTGTITTVAGTGIAGLAGDGGQATQAQLNQPSTVAVDAKGVLYIYEAADIRAVSPTGIITTIAGNGTASYSGDGGLSTKATLNGPTGMAMDTNGNIFFADTVNNVVRELSPAWFFADGVVNSASLQPGAVSPGEIITIFGASIGPAGFAYPSLTASGTFSTTIGNTQVLFDGTPAAMLFASSGQVSAIVPYEISGQTQTNVQIVNQGQPLNTVTLNVAVTAPGLFTSNSSGTGQAAALNQDGSVNSAANPAAAGSIVVLFGTGEGQTSPGGVDGALANGTYPAPQQAVSVTIGAASSQAGAAIAVH